MQLLEEFKIYLRGQKHRPADLTIKNYIADVRKFILWYENALQKPFTWQGFTGQIIDLYKESLLKNTNKRDQIISKTVNQPLLASSSFDRYLSSLRKFSLFISQQHTDFLNPFSLNQQIKKANLDPWELKSFRNYLYEGNASSLTIKNYINDVKHFLTWLTAVSWTKPNWEVKEESVFEHLNQTFIEEYQNRLLNTLKFSPVSVNRKLSALRKYCNWAQQANLIKHTPFIISVAPSVNSSFQAPTRFDSLTAISSYRNRSLSSLSHGFIAKSNPYSVFGPLRLAQKSAKGLSILFDLLCIIPFVAFIEKAQFSLWILKGRPVFVSDEQFISAGKQPRSSRQAIKNIPKELYAPLTISTKNLSWYRKIVHYIRHSRPKWYKKYHSYSLVHYLHFAILMISCFGISVLLYNSFTNTERSLIASASQSTSPSRILTLKQRLTDLSGQPITAETSLRFGLYNDPFASGSALLWQDVKIVHPDSNGFYTVRLGTSQPIPQELFNQNNQAFLGVTLGQGSEMTPRQQITTTSYADNADRLQGLIPITDPTAGTKNVVLALDSTGNLTIGGSASPTFQATGGEFRLSGQTLSLVTNPTSNGNIVLNPDGTGKIDLQGILQNTSNHNSVGATPGSVEVDDTFSILATSSAQPAFQINQNSIGPLISASVNGTAKFSLDYLGAGTFADNLAVNGGSLTTTTTTANLFNTAAINLNIGENASSISIGSSSGTTTINNRSTDLKGNLLVDGSSGANFTGTDATINFSGTGNHTIQAAAGKLSIGEFTANGSISVEPNVNISPRLANGTNSLGSANNPWTSLYVTKIVSPDLLAQTFWQSNNNVLSTSNDLQVQTSGSPIWQIFGSGSNTGTASSSGNLAFTGNNTQINQLNNGTISLQTSPGGDEGLISRLFIKNNGAIGIGTILPQFKLDILDSKDSTAASQIYNSSSSLAAAGLNIKLGNISSTAISSTNHFINFQTTGIGTIGSIQGNGAQGVSYATSGIADFAEYLKKDISESIPFGSVICLDTNGRAALCADQNSRMVGVSSEHPTFLGGTDLGSGSVAVALLGQVSLRVSTENGIIVAGDPLTESDIPGVAIKATKSGPIIGRALESYQADPYTIGKVLALISPSWHDSDVTLTDTGSLSIKQTSNDPNSYSLYNSIGDLIGKVGAFSDLAAASVKAGFIGVSQLAVDGSAVIAGDLKAQSIHAQEIAANSISIAGVNLQDYILNLIHQSRLVIPIPEQDTIIAHTIASSDSTIAASLNQGLLTIRNLTQASQAAVATIDNQGNASFSGTLRAKKIIADEIVGLNQATNSATTITNINNIYTNTSNATSSSTLANNANVLPFSQTNLQSTNTPETSTTRIPTDLAQIIQKDYANIASLSGQLGYIPTLKADFATINQGLISLGPVSLTDVSVAGQLSIAGSMIIGQNSINAIGTDLALQSLRQGNISFMGGLMTIDTEGNITAAGNANFAKNVQVSGTLSASILSPIPNSDLLIRLGNSQNSTNQEPTNPQLVIHNASGSGIFNISQLGDVLASGSGSFSNLAAKTFTIIRGVQADTSATETIASSSAGTAIILSHQTERTIITPFVKANSLIYITSVSDTQGANPYIARQTEGNSANDTKSSFTIQIPTSINNDLKVNWWIVN